MKKAFPCILIILLLLSGCADTTAPFGENTEITESTDGYIFDNTTSRVHGILSCDNNSDGNASGDELRGVWLSYYEIDVDSSRDTREEYASYIDKLCRSFSQYRITDAFVQVRPYADALYKSNVYPTSSYAGVNQGAEAAFDQLEVICEVMGSYSIKVHAWVNPYRVHNGTDIEELCETNKARLWYKSYSNEDVAIVGGKIYFNPSSEKAKQLVVDGAREILLNYPVAGIHIDDYFYPPDCGSFDQAQYNAYISYGGTLTLDDWRRNNVNSLVASLYSAVKQFGEDKIFSISPAGNIEKNKTELYADVALWSKGGYADMIIPQIYFGFEHETHGFTKCMADWYVLKGADVKMPVGLALYKSGTEDSFAGTGKDEWLSSSDIITRQVQHIRSTGGDGFVIFSSELFIGSSAASDRELEKLRIYLDN